MPKPDFYSILGVPVDANTQAIKDAYRRQALKVHPDAGYEPDPTRFRHLHEAYLTLSDMERRRSYDAEVLAPRPRMIEENRAWWPVRVPDDFQSVAPSIGEMLDHIAQNFFGFHLKSGGSRRRLEVEIVLSREEAMTGGRLPVEVPCYEPCPQCHGRVWMWGLCPHCHGYGLSETTRSVKLDIAPGIANGSSFEISLGRLGIDNMVLDVMVLVA